MFKEVETKADFPTLEERVLEFWQSRDIFRKSMERLRDAPRFVFYEGPPTANGLPGIHHVLGRVYKDTIPRYQTMKGNYCLRKGGWDTHGLPVEIEVEKELGFTGRGKQAIEEYGVAKFNQLCKESVFRYVKQWTSLSDRIGFWLDMDDPYVTLSNDYIESVWWILKQIWDKGLLYKGYKSVPYCPRCETPLSDHEVAQGYRETEDPSIYVKFPLRDEPGVYLLAWTTTPWTLPGNAALAVHPDVEYVEVEQNEERLILAKPLTASALRGDHTVIRTLQAKELVGKHYKPLYTFMPVEKDYCYVLAADFVNTEEGTGVVHVAPAFGSEDLEVGKEHDLPVLQTVDVHGKFVDAVRPWRGMFVKDADPLIIHDLLERGLMYHVGRCEHVYPFCWRCGSPLLYYGKPTWFIATQQLKERLLANNREINWYPAHIREGRFGNWLENNVDWALGRDRYWGTPLPMWSCERCDQVECFGSVEELRTRASRSKRVGLGRSSFDLPELDLHRPYIDDVTVQCTCGGTMRRAPEVIDCWFDSGSMPVAQWHYPFENEDRFVEQFPADFICEGIDQTRGWFYSLHAIATLLFDKPCFRNCVSFGHVLDAEGQKMSKSKGNVVDPWDVIRVYGADAMRWSFYTSSPPDYPRRFSLDLVAESVRKFALTLRNTYAFFVTYAKIDAFDPRLPAPSPDQRPPLDRWILSELNRLVLKVDDDLAHYEMTRPARAIQEFVDVLSNWYVRRSRRRFWKSEVDADKSAAHHTLYHCLVTLCKLIAPFQPFTAEEMYQNLVRSVYPDEAESVHLTQYPNADHSLIDEQLVQETQTAMRVVALGHAARNQAGIKVRQPLRRAMIKPRREEETVGLQRLQDQISDELNVKEVTVTTDEGDLVDYRLGIVPRNVGRKYKSLLPAIKKAVEGLSGRAALEAARRVDAGQPLELTVEVLDVRLEPEDVEVRKVAPDGYAIAEDAGYLVAINVQIDESLQLEGLAREVVRRIQTLRKEADFRIEDTITTWYSASAGVAKALELWGDYIREETLSNALLAEEPPPDTVRATFEVDGESLTLAVRRSPADR